MGVFETHAPVRSDDFKANRHVEGLVTAIHCPSGAPVQPGAPLVDVS